MKNGDKVWTVVGEKNKPKAVQGIIKYYETSDPICLFTWESDGFRHTKEVQVKHVYSTEQAAIEGRIKSFQSKAFNLRLQADACDRQAERLKQQLLEKV